MPRPKWYCHTRLTIERRVRRFAGSVIHLAKAARRWPSSSGSLTWNFALSHVNSQRHRRGRMHWLLHFAAP